MMFITRTTTSYYNFLSQLSASVVQPKWRQDQFDRIDTNHDGVIQRSEWDEAMQVWPQVQSVLVGSRCLDIGLLESWLRWFAYFKCLVEVTVCWRHVCWCLVRCLSPDDFWINDIWKHFKHTWQLNSQKVSIPSPPCPHWKQLEMDDFQRLQFSTNLVLKFFFGCQRQLQNCASGPSGDSPLSCSGDFFPIRNPMIRTPTYPPVANDVNAGR